MRRVSVDIGGTFTDCFVAWAMTSTIESNAAALAAPASKSSEESES